MQSRSPNPWTLRGVIFVIWALAAGAAAYWGLKLASRPTGAVVAVAQRTAAAPSDPAAVARLLGSAPQAAAAASPVINLATRFALIGVVAGSSRGGAALIAVDGKPPKPFRVGTSIEEGLLLQAVEGRRAVLAKSADGPPVLTLEMPALKR